MYVGGFKKFFNLLSSLLYLFKKVRHKQDGLVFLISIFTVYNFILNTNQNIKNSSQYQYEPIFWKLNSILNDSILSIYILLLLYTYMFYNYRLKVTKVSVIIGLYFIIHSIKMQFIFVNLIKITPYNTTLFNGLLLIHPICLYLSYGYIIYTFIITHKYKTKPTNYFTLFTKKNKFFLTSSLIALLLGCWWAQQEVSWGGWWNWDPIEMIALLALIISLISNHTPYKYQKLVFFFRPTLYLFVITTYVVSRYDILNSIHSFALASKSQHYIELKLTFLYSIIYFTVVFFVKKSQVTNIFNFFTSTWIIFYCYFAYIIGTILYNIGLNVITSVNTTPSGDKFSYLSLFLIFCIKIFHKNSTNKLSILLVTLLLLFWDNQSFFATLVILIFIITYRYNFHRSSYPTPLFYKTGFFHILLLFLVYLLITYSNVEIFFTKSRLETYFNKSLTTVTAQQTNIKNHFSDGLCFTRASTEVFFQKTTNLVKLLTQNILSNNNYNVNKINLSKIVYFVQNYLYWYGLLILLIILIWLKKIHKSGIV